MEISIAAERASKLTRQLLAFSRKQVLDVQIVDLSELVADMGSMLRRLLGENLELHLNLDRTIMQVEADPGQVEQALLNLVVNARDAMPEGGLLTIETSNTMVDELLASKVTRLAPGHYVQLSVSDSGTGMDEATRSRIFEPFFTTKSKGKGTGLGLSMVYGFVKQSGGDISVYSEPGTGTTIKIYLPVAKRQAPAFSDEESRPLRTTGTETILVVEDVENLRTFIKRGLERYGYTVFMAANGNEALGILEHGSEGIDLVLSDVFMPGMNGTQLAERIAEVHKDVRVLFMSGYTDDVLEHHDLLNNGSALLKKPFNLASLGAVVRNVLDANRATGQ
jgi:CheY-like chemotaxis protein